MPLGMYERRQPLKEIAESFLSAVAISHMALCNIFARRQQVHIDGSEPIRRQERLQYVLVRRQVWGSYIEGLLLLGKVLIAFE